MQKNILILSLLIAFSISCGYSQNRSIQFHEKPWAEIVAMAKKENKMIFLDAYASWCGPCKWMAANMFTNDTIADYYNKTFICASIDMEKGEGLSLRKKYGVKAYPSLIFINTDENMVHEKVGAAQKVKDYINMAKVAQDPEICLSACLKKYQEGNNSPEFIAVYLARLMDAYIQPGPAMKKYYQTQSESDLLSLLVPKLIQEYKLKNVKMMLKKLEHQISEANKNDETEKLMEFMSQHMKLKKVLKTLSEGLGFRTVN